VGKIFDQKNHQFKLEESYQMDNKPGETTSQETGRLIQIDEEQIKGHLDQIVVGAVEETLNGLLEKEAERLCPAGRCERKEERAGYRSGHYRRKMHVKAVAAMLKAIHAQEGRKEAREKAVLVIEKWEELKLGQAATIVLEGVEETLSYYDFPSEHWRSLRTNNPLERINREIRRRTRVVGCFPDERSAVMLVAARLRHIAGSEWGEKHDLNMERLWQQQQEAVLQAASRVPFDAWGRKQSG
jgi:transposase-like protein